MGTPNPELAFAEAIQDLNGLGFSPNSSATVKSPAVTASPNGIPSQRLPGSAIDLEEERRLLTHPGSQRAATQVHNTSTSPSVGQIIGAVATPEVVGGVATGIAVSLVTGFLRSFGVIQAWNAIQLAREGKYSEAGKELWDGAKSLALTAFQMTLVGTACFAAYDLGMAGMALIHGDYAGAAALGVGALLSGGLGLLGARTLFKGSVEKGVQKVAEGLAEKVAEKVMEQVGDELSKEVLQELSKNVTNTCLQELSKMGAEQITKESATQLIEKVSYDMTRQFLGVTAEIAELEAKEGSAALAKTWLGDIVSDVMCETLLEAKKGGLSGFKTLVAENCQDLGWIRRRQVAKELQNMSYYGGWEKYQSTFVEAVFQKVEGHMAEHMDQTFTETFSAGFRKLAAEKGLSNEVTEEIIAEAPAAFRRGRQKALREIIEAGVADGIRRARHIHSQAYGEDSELRLAKAPHGVQLTGGPQEVAHRDPKFDFESRRGFKAKKFKVGDYGTEVYKEGEEGAGIVQKQSGEKAA